MLKGYPFVSMSSAKVNGNKEGFNVVERQLRDAKMHKYRALQKLKNKGYHKK